MSYVNVTDYINSTYTHANEEPSNEVTGDDFLTLLVAQLQNQDPLNPMEDAEMLAELAQFSSLEQLAELNENFEALADDFNTLIVNSAMSYIGMNVVAEGNCISLTDGKSTELKVTLAEDAESALAYIYDENNELVATTSLSRLNSGEQTFTWDGSLSTGETAPDGIYSVYFYALNAEGDTIDVSSLAEGTVVGLNTENGSTVFELSDGRTVNMLNITSVSSPS